jgi:hypothetical protein
MSRQSRRATAGGYEPGHLRHGGDDSRCWPSCFIEWRRSRTAACAGSAPLVRRQSHLVLAATGNVVFMRVKELVIAATALVAFRSALVASRAYCCTSLLYIVRIADLLLAAQPVMRPLVRADYSCR